MSPSGATGDCGSRPSTLATSRVGVRAIARPSSSTCPDVGRSSRPSARSSVDLPQPLGPTIAVKEPSVSVEVQVVDDDAVVVGQPHVLGGETDPFGPGQGELVTGSIAAFRGRGARAGRARRSRR